MFFMQNITLQSKFLVALKALPNIEDSSQVLNENAIKVLLNNTSSLTQIDQAYEVLNKNINDDFLDNSQNLDNPKKLS